MPRSQWQLTDHDYLFDDVEVKVLTATGLPRKDVDVYEIGGATRAAAGSVQVRRIPEV
jgi:hypothetical protein